MRGRKDGRGHVREGERLRGMEGKERAKEVDRDGAREGARTREQARRQEGSRGRERAREGDSAQARQKLYTVFGHVQRVVCCSVYITLAVTAGTYRQILADSNPNTIKVTKY